MNKLPRGIGAILIGFLWLIAIGVSAAAGLEILLKTRSRWQQLPFLGGSSQPDQPRLNELLKAYEPFAIRHLHPQYLFFFPLNPADRVAISNSVCSLTPEGFRGPGPAQAGGRRLAFLLGGSAAFGFMAGSDATTITGYLNVLQDRYFFVNAAVPGWNSTQEMFRLAFQILEYRPSLIVTYDGANDAGHLAYYQGDSRASGAFRYPVGTPESFDLLAARVDDIESRAPTLAILDALLPEVTRWITARSGASADPIQASLAPDVLKEGAARYLTNQKAMHHLSAAVGARFVSVFQPHLSLHTHVAPEVANTAEDSIVRFHRAVLDQRGDAFEFHDLGALFDEPYAQVPVVTGRRGTMTDVTKDTIFIGRVHVHDAGNEIVARRLAQIIQ